MTTEDNEQLTSYRLKNVEKRLDEFDILFKDIAEKLTKIHEALLVLGTFKQCPNPGACLTIEPRVKALEDDKTRRDTERATAGKFIGWIWAGLVVMGSTLGFVAKIIFDAIFNR